MLIHSSVLYFVLIDEVLKSGLSHFNHTLAMVVF